MHPLKALKVLVSTLAFVGLVACNPMTESASEGSALGVAQALVQTDPIQDVLKSSRQGAIVHLKGRVKNRVPLLEGIVYELQDETGSIWVVTREASLNQGDEVVIQGKLHYQSIQLHGKEQGSAYVEQQEQIQHTPAVQSQ
jgi:hypothetical protein